MGEPAVQLEPVPEGTKGRTRRSAPTREAVMDRARHPLRLIGHPPPLRPTFVGAPQDALLFRALPLARARSQLATSPLEL